LHGCAVSVLCERLLLVTLYFTRYEYSQLNLPPNPLPNIHDVLWRDRMLQIASGCSQLWYNVGLPPPPLPDSRLPKTDSFPNIASSCGNRYDGQGVGAKFTNPDTSLRIVIPRSPSLVSSPIHRKHFQSPKTRLPWHAPSQFHPH